MSVENVIAPLECKGETAQVAVSRELDNAGSRGSLRLSFAEDLLQRGGREVPVGDRNVLSFEQGTSLHWKQARSNRPLSGVRRATPEQLAKHLHSPAGWAR